MNSEALEIDDVPDDLVGCSREALLSDDHVAPRLVLESGTLIHSDAVAAIPVHRCAAQSEVDGRHRASPLHEAGESGELMWIVNSDEIPLAWLAECAAPAEDSSAQEHAICRFTRGDR